MDGGGVVLQGVVNSDFDCVTPVALNRRSWNLTVDSKCRSWCAIKVPLDVGNGEIILADRASIWPGRVLISVDTESIAP